jgi:hypothetical protein
LFERTPTIGCILRIIVLETNQNSIGFLSGERIGGTWVRNTDIGVYKIF